jgi:hypothetical protein
VWAVGVGEALWVLRVEATPCHAHLVSLFKLHAGGALEKGNQGAGVVAASTRQVWMWGGRAGAGPDGRNHFIFLGIGLAPRVFSMCMRIVM